MIVDLSGRTVLLTGASRGIGQETARALGASGARVIAQWGSNRAGAEEATADMEPANRLLLQADFTDRTAPARLWEEAVAWAGRIDVLVNNAAVMPSAGLDDPDEVWQAAWDASLEVNIRQPTSLMREAVRHFRVNGGGVIVTMSSWAGQRGSGNPSLTAYAASKAALAAATKTIARAHARDGVLAYCVAPGAVDTDMTIRSANDLGGRQAVEAALTMGELVPPAELADLIACLASGRFRHLSGATIDVNGASYIR